MADGILLTDVQPNIEFRETGALFKTLIDTPALKVVMINLKKGQRVDWHRANVQISVFVERGVIQFGVREDGAEETHRMLPGMSITLKANLDHNLSAEQDSVVLVYKTPNPQSLLRLE
ncbi:cupin domain-containing protein [Effusibacillus dendaii]|uniref:Cupin n=1 Tax=Effusibacillus dendaii TaxID=2743772 RepID=A0A7I8D506_9BACL|nr:hypothetical protein [Effusibacillus dendaii]BCJ85174.1 hypothetical protein skT53_01590 [Effusibacillus dendaii]